MLQIDMTPGAASAPPSVVLLTPENAGRLLGIPKQTLAAWRCNRRVNLPYVKVGRHIRYRLADLLAFVESNRREVAA
jgi:excisionase family DNA binding protein